MKATDLMVGDWVSYCGFYNKVIYIGQKVSMYNGKGTEFTTDPEYIRPIPLTEEILVKNGLKLTQGLDFYWFDDKKHCFMKNYDGKRLFCYRQGVNDVWLVVKYVHQLQHLLRLCNVQKEIEL